ncbi:MAG: hypothetical protein AAFQ89_10540 [Cyanobacteria bacterium J06626_18]
MSQTIVNLALPVITSKIDAVLDTYPAAPYQQAFASAALREKLTAYVLRRVPTLYATAETATACSSTVPTNCFSGDQHIQMDRLIHQGIRHLMAHQKRREAMPQSASVGSQLMPSSWFG